MNLTKTRTAKFVASIAGFALALAFVVTPVSTSAVTVADLQAQIAALTAQLAQLGGSTPATVGSYTFNTNLTLGSKGTDVMNLQKVLNGSSDTQVSASGAGSPGNETSFFGPATKAAVVKFQTKYGISPAAGYVGPVTRAKLNTMSGTTTGGTTGTTLPTGGSVSVMAGTQPANSLAPQSAARLPFTVFTVTAGSSDVTLNSVTVERVGLAEDAAFAGVVLLKSDGTQVGISRTLNSNSQANVGEAYVVKAGTTETFTVAGNMGSNLSSYTGQVAGLKVVAVNTSATVTGSLPITGAQHTINSNLTLGSVSMNVSSYDPNTSQTKEIGTTGYKFAGVRVTAGSAEDVRVGSIRWNQTGSASMNDLANVKVYVDGTAYDTTVSADGKYYSANFGSGLVVSKGLSKDIYVQGDIVGGSAAGRTVIFDIYKATDLYLKGETYGYGITPPAGLGSASDDNSAFTAGTPWFDGSKVTISAGSVTSIGKATSVPAANIAVNVPNQILGGFTTDIKGEPITVQQMVFTIATTGAWTSTEGITGITIVDSNGAVVAGPIDEATTCTSGCSVTFTDAITFPVGQKTYTVKGKIPSGAPNGATVVVSTTPSSGWTSVTGDTTGNTITLSNGAFSMNTMTVKAAALTVTVSTSPAAQSIVSGGTITFANYVFDASQSGENVRFGSIPLAYDRGDNAKAAAPSKLTSCQLFDGLTPLNTGSNVVNPSSTATTSSPSSQTVTLDSQFTVEKGTVKTLTWKCNVSTSADSSSVFQWGLTNVSSMTVTGVTSGVDVSENLVTGNGQVMTVATGSFTASVDSSTPNYLTASAGTTGVPMGVFKFRASNESVNLSKVGLILTSGTVSDIGTVYLYNGSDLLGTATFTSEGTTATSSLNKILELKKDEDILVTIKADLGLVGTGQTGTQGKLVKIDVTNAEGSGVSSGTTLQVGGVSAGVNGVRMFKSFPVVAQDTLSSTGVADGKLMRFKVTADSHGPVGLFNLNFTVATSSFATGGGVSAVKVMVYSDSAYSQPVSGSYGATTGQFGSTATPSSNAPELNFSASTNALTIPAGTTYYFQVEGTVASTQTGTSVTTTLNGDAEYIDTAHLVGNVSTTTGALADTNNDFIWSGNATSTATIASGSNDLDWVNGYGVLGLPSSGFSTTRSN